MSAPPTLPPKMPAKVPIKMPVKMAIKVPVMGVKVPIPAPARPTAAGTPLAAPPVSTVASPAPKKPSVVDDDDDMLFAAPKTQTPPAPAPKPTRPAPTVTKRRIAAKRVKEESSDEEEEQVKEKKPQGPEDRTIYQYCLERGIVPEQADALLVPVSAPIAPPPRPPMHHSLPKDLDAYIEKLRVQIENEKAKRRTEDDTKNVSLGTSKINYIDPRICFAWAKREGVDPKKIYSNTTMKKFTWAAGVDPGYDFLDPNVKSGGGEDEDNEGDDDENEEDDE